MDQPQEGCEGRRTSLISPTAGHYKQGTFAKNIHTHVALCEYTS